MKTGSVPQRTRAGPPQTLKEELESLRAAYTVSPRKSIHRTFEQLQVPHSAIHEVLLESLRIYEVQLLQALKPENRP